MLYQIIGTVPVYGVAYTYDRSVEPSTVADLHSVKNYPLHIHMDF